MDMHGHKSCELQPFLVSWYIIPSFSTPILHLARHKQETRKHKIDDILRNDVVTTKDGRWGWVINPNSDG